MLSCADLLHGFQQQIMQQCISCVAYLFVLCPQHVCRCVAATIAGVVATGIVIGAVAGSQSADTHTSNGSSAAKQELNRGTVEAAYATFRRMEAPLQQQLIELLNLKPDVTIMGPAHADVSTRVATVSFAHKHKTSKSLTGEIQKRGFAMRNGHMFAMRLTERLVDLKHVRSVDDGVVRISLLHYNTPEEVRQLVQTLDTIL